MPVDLNEISEKIPEGKREEDEDEVKIGDYYIANIIVQKRTKSTGRISGIFGEFLLSSLNAVAQEALK